MTIAFVINQLIVGGAEQYVITKTEWLINKGYNIIVISEGGIWEDKLPKGSKHYRLNGIMYSPYNKSHIEYLRFLKSLSQILIDNKVDLVEGQNTWPIIHVVNSYNLHRKPFYFNILNELSLHHNPLLQKTTKLLDGQHLYYTLTRKMNTYIESKCRCDLHPTILNIPVKSSNVGQISDGKYILSVSRMSQEKMYVKSLIYGYTKAILNNRKLPHKLVIVGDGPLLNEVKELAELCNKKIGEEKIIIKGTVIGSDLDALFASCSVYVGMGTTLLTAASMAKPCIRCGFEEATMTYAWGFWGDDRETDKDEIVFSSDNLSSGQFPAISYEDIFNRILTDEDCQNKKGKAAYELYKICYSMETTMVGWQKEYEKILAGFSDDNMMSIYKNIRRATKIYKYIYRIYTLKQQILK